jgi:hypothetical protein
MANVMEALAKCSAHERTIGKTDVDPNKEGVGYGYVNPGQGHECGGALFDAATRTVRQILPRAAWLTGAAKRTEKRPESGRARAGRRWKF